MEEHSAQQERLSKAATAALSPDWQSCSKSWLQELERVDSAAEVEPVHRMMLRAREGPGEAVCA